MTDLAWLKTFAGTHLASTSHLSPEEFGVFERLRLHYWMRNGLPNDDAQLMRMSGVSPDRWEDVRSAICGLFDEGWRLPSLDEEREAAGEKRAKAVERSAKAHAARYGKTRHASSTATSTATSNATSSHHDLPEAVLDAVLTDCPSASASDEVRYDERLAPTRARAETRSFPKTSRRAPPKETRGSFGRVSGPGTLRPSSQS